MSQLRDDTRHLPALPAVFALICSQPKAFWVFSLFHILALLMRILPGWIEKSIFDTLSGAAPARVNIWTLVAFYASAEIFRLVLTFGDIWSDVTFRYLTGGLMRRNLFAAILSRRLDQPLPVSSGDAIARFRDDVDELADFPLWLPHMFGEIVSSAVAIAIMASINLEITLFIFLPIAGTMVVSRLAWHKIKTYTDESRAAASRVTGFLGEIFHSVQAIQVATAESNVIARLDQLSSLRRNKTVRLRVFSALLESLYGTTASIGIGMVLLLSGQAIASGTFTVGDFALFVYYLWFTTEIPLDLGTFYGDYRAQEVSITRMLQLVHPLPATVLVEDKRKTAGVVKSAESQTTRPGDRLRDMELRNFSSFYSGYLENSQRVKGIEGVNLKIERGSLTVVTGRIGSGKSTLLRAILGLLPLSNGEICWNGNTVDDPATWFRPPRCAYTPQSPRLFSETLRENIALGWPINEAGLERAIWQGVLEGDIKLMERGPQTLIGPRGLRLSGGQVQRCAAARMFARNAELYLIDDVSSALDLNTEHSLWERFLSQPDITSMVVTHRRMLLQRADQVIVMQDGQVVGQGVLEQLLESCAEMRRLWEQSSEEESKT